VENSINLPRRCERGISNNQVACPGRDEILTSLFKNGLRLKLSKCRFGQISVETLGFRVSHDSIVPSDKHIKTLAEWQEPTSGQELLRFIGVVPFFGRYVSNCSDKAAPLYELLSGTGWKKNRRVFPFAYLNSKSAGSTASVVLSATCVTLSPTRRS
jgi:hypothetical protein